MQQSVAMIRLTRQIFNYVLILLILFSTPLYAAAPTLVSYTETASWITGGTSKATPGAVSWQTGDILVHISGTENDVFAAPAVPTGTGITFSSVQLNNGIANTCSGRLSTATAASNGSSIITTTYGNAVPHWGFGVWVWRNSTGVGNSIEQHTTTKTKALTITSVNSAVMIGAFDFGAGTTGSGTPAVTNTRQNTQDTSHYTLLVFDNIDYSTSGSLWGQSGGTGSAAISIFGVEILNSGGGAGGCVPKSGLTLTGAGCG